MIYSLKDHAAAGDVRALLKVAACDNPASAHGFGAAAITLASFDERLPRAVLRCAFAGCIRLTRGWNMPDEEVAARSERHRRQVQAAVDAELAWLADEHPEPNWAAFPSAVVRRRRGLRLPGGLTQQEDTPAPQRSRPHEYVDYQAAGLWLGIAKSLGDVSEQPWLREIVRTYGPWTVAANGAGLDAHEEVTDPPREWNNAYFDLLAHCLPGLASTEVDELALAPISSLPDEPFFDVMTLFLRSVDAVYFNNSILKEPTAINIRSALAHRLMASGGWERLGRSRSASIEIHIGSGDCHALFQRSQLPPTRQMLLASKRC
jgi:hypothetical protein